MAKVLKLTKPDRSIHITPLANKGFYVAMNNRLAVGAKWRLEEVEEEDVVDHPPVDKDYVMAHEAQGKVADLNAELKGKDQEIEDLKAQLEELQKSKAGKDASHQSDIPDELKDSSSKGKNAKSKAGKDA